MVKKGNDNENRRVKYEQSVRICLAKKEVNSFQPRCYRSFPYLFGL